jgi:D-alanyl-D-alanine carboxypeptidase
MGRAHKATLAKPRYSPGLICFLGLVCFLAGAGNLFAVSSAFAEPALVMDVNSGDVLYEEQATDPWYPASLTKLMTMYVALSAVRDRKISLDTPLVVSARAALQAPSKMGFAPGTQVTLDNALKMLMVKSANDMAITVAEGVSGSVEAFAEDMNAAAASLGLHQSHFVNPNGLHDPTHVSSARDLAQIARALYLTFPEHAGIYGIGSLQLGDEMIPTHNTLLGRYPGADGMKTGFTCSSGFNIVAGATRGDHHYIAVILGAPSVFQREVKAAILLDRAFYGIDQPHGASAFLAQPQVQHAAVAAPDMHERVCKRGRIQTMARFQAELKALQAPLANQGASFVVSNALFVAAPNPAQEASLMGRKLSAMAPGFDPVSVYVGPAPGYSGLVAQVRPPHSPVGTEPPPQAASAYAPSKGQGLATGESPLKPDATALPMKGQERRGKVAAAINSRKAIVKAKAVGDDEAAPVAKKAHAKSAAKAVVQKTSQVTKLSPHRTSKTTAAKAVGDDAKPAKPKGDTD